MARPPPLIVAPEPSSPFGDVSIPFPNGNRLTLRMTKEEHRALHLSHELFAQAIRAATHHNVINTPDVQLWIGQLRQEYTARFMDAVARSRRRGLDVSHPILNLMSLPQHGVGVTSSLEREPDNLR